MNKNNQITLDEVKNLISMNHVVFAYPKKCKIVVDGFKRYNADKSVFEFLKK